MTRLLLSSVVLAALAGAVTPALADGGSSTEDDTVHYVCLTGSHQPGSPTSEGLCVWVPLPVAQPR